MGTLRSPPMSHSTVHIADYAAAGEPFHFARKTLSRDRAMLHDHDCHEFFWVESGSAAHVVNGVEKRLGPGDAVFVRPGDVHRLAAAERVPCQVGNLMFGSEAASHLVTRYSTLLAGRLFWTEGALPDAIRLDAARLARLVALADALAAAPRELVHVDRFLLELLVQVVDAPAPPAPELPAWLAQACAQARQPDVFRAGAAGLVKAAGRSHEHVCRAVKRYLGTSPSGYVNAIRMEHAAHLLTRSDATVVEVSLDCGIDNASHFHRLFRERFGTTPCAYRRSALESGAG